MASLSKDSSIGLYKMDSPSTSSINDLSSVFQPNNFLLNVDAQAKSLTLTCNLKEHERASFFGTNLFLNVSVAWVPEVVKPFLSLIKLWFLVFPLHTCQPVLPPSFLSSLPSYFSSFPLQDFLGQTFCTLGEIVGSPASRLEKPLGWVSVSGNFLAA